MKVSILTVSLNSQKTIAKTLNSVLCQDYPNIEHILVDGFSDDATLTYLKDYPLINKKIFIKKLKLYEAINFAITKATGDYILFLHSDDILNSSDTISKLVSFVKRYKYEILIGSVAYFSNNIDKVLRFFPSKNFKKEHLFKGLIAPHTGMFIKTSLQKKYLYNQKFKIASDFEFFLKCLIIDNNRFKLIDLLITRMKTGGVSTKNILSYIQSSSEIIQSFNDNKLNFSRITIYLRFIFKLNQFFLISEKLKKQKLNYFFHPFYKKKCQYDFIIYKNYNKLLLKKKFIYSAMNLAFLGSWVKDYTLQFPHIYHWTDGISAKLLDKNIKKIPGREILQNLKIPKSIKKIIVVGNLSRISRNLLLSKYKKKIFHIKVPYASANEIANSIKYKFKKNELVFITLPTPKQELVAIELAKKNNFYKIICIGGSIAIFSGEEKEVPSFLNNIEFIWRLQYETFRRSKRLLSTLISVLFDFAWSRKIKNLKVNVT